jgi:multidrug efflux pump subunit AcrA (membrane-fusion protein)
MSRPRSRYVRPVLRGTIALAVVAALATAAVAATSSHGTTYRTAAVTRATVNAELHKTGSISPVAQATVAFPVSGSVATVPVKVGQVIATGTTLATLETSALQAALTTKNAALAAAELTLEKVLSGESVSAGGSGSGGSGTGSSASASARSATTSAASAAATSPTTTPATAPTSRTQPTSGSGSNSALAAARKAVADAQHQVQSALAAADAALEQAMRACSSAPSPTTTTTAPTLSCGDAQAAVLRDLHTVATSEQKLAQAESKLSALLATANPTPPTTPSPRTTTPTTTPSRASTTVTYTAQQIASFTTAVLAAGAEVAAAQQNLAQTTVVSPIAGTIAAINLAVGDSVAAQSSTANVVVVGNGGYEVTTTVTVAERANVKVGDGATVVADGAANELRGQVVAIGVVATTDANGGATTYPVVVGFTDESAASALRNGASAAVTIEVARSVQALTVPTSAVHTIGTFHTVTVLTKNKPSVVRVQIGTVGTERTAITSGLRAGQVVVLADLGQSIPSAGTNTNPFGRGTFGTGFTGTRGFGAGGARQP